MKDASPDTTTLTELARTQTTATEATKAELARLFDQGASLRALSAALTAGGVQVSHDTVRRWLS